MSRPLPTYFIVLIFLCAGALCAQTVENGRSVLEIGFEQRVRNENFNNAFDLSDQFDDEREQIRYRTRLWINAFATPDITFSAGLNQESRQVMGKVNQFDEVMFETAYVDFKRVFVNGLSLRVGRQNLQRGEGFLLLEGSPGDGSRTIYFNAVDLAYTRGKSKIELIGILNPSRDRFFPRIHDRRRVLQDSDEQALGLYLTNANLRSTNLEAYYFYKKEVNNILPASNPQFQPDRYVHTSGGRVVRLLGSAWTATGEFATQWGTQRPGREINAWGGYGYLRRSFKHDWRPYVQAGYWGLSGDDPSTPDRIEDWDPLFGRWPKWSELYLYSLQRERGVGYWTNLGMWQAEAGFSPRQPLNMRLTYYHMDSFHPFPGDPNIFGRGTGRGDLFQARMDFTIKQNWRGHALYEGLLPGNFYSAANKSYFVRFELIYQFQTALLRR